MYSYIPNVKHSVSKTFCAIWDSLDYALKQCIFLKKDDFFMKYFKLVHAPAWKIPHFMNGFLFMCTRHEAIGTANVFALSATPLCFTRYILFEKDDFWCMPQIERFLIIWKVFYLYVQGKQQFVSSTIFLYLRLSYALDCTFFGKRWFFFMKYFKLVHASTWKIPHYMKVFLSIWTRHREFAIFNFFGLSVTP